MTKKTVEEQLTAIIPSGIDDVIRAHRYQVSLRISTPADLHPLRSTIAGHADGIPVSRWLFVTLDVHIPGLAQQTVHLLGLNENEGHSWCTSPVTKLNRATRLLYTRSGTLYRLRGTQGTEQDLDLLRLCAYLHQTRIGGYLGVPHIFY